MVHRQAPPNASLNATFGALSDPTRRAILARLIERDFAVGELAQPFDMSLPAVSKHLRVLERAGLVRREKVSRIVRCRLQAEPMEAAARWLDQYQRFWTARLDALGRYLASRQEEPSPQDEESSTWPTSSTPSKSRSRSRGTTRSRRRKSSARGPTRRR
jgi:DNA-binding transcriptional ArsR family regulator